MDNSILIYSGLMFLSFTILYSNWDRDCPTRVIIRKLKRKQKFRKNKGEHK